MAASLDARLQPPDYRGIKLDLGIRADVLHWRDVIMGRSLHSVNGAIDLPEIFAGLPVAVLIPVTFRDIAELEFRNSVQSPLYCSHSLVPL